MERMSKTIVYGVAALGAACLLGLASTPRVSAQAVEAGVQIFLPTFYSQYRPETALALVWRTPGFTLQTGDQGRGLAGSEGNVLINGVRPPPRGSSIYNLLGAIRIEDVVRIELIEAGARDVDMQGHPRLLNVVTTAQTTRRVNGRLRQERREDDGQTTSFSAGGRVNGDGFSYEASLNGSDTRWISYGGFYSVTPDYPEPRLSADSALDIRQLNFNGSGSIALSPRTDMSLSVTAQDYQQASGLLDLGPHDPDHVRSLSEYDRNQQTLSVTWRQTLAESLSVQTVLALDEEESVYESSFLTQNQANSYESITTESERALRSTLRWTGLDGVALETGVSWAFNSLDGDSRTYFDRVLQVVDGSAARVEETRSALFGSAEWTPVPRLTASLYGRVERFELISSNAPGQTYELTDFLPRADLRYRINENWTVRWESELEIGQLYLGRFLASTDLSNQLNTSGATQLEPLRTWRREAGVERSLDGGGFVHLSAWRARVENPISTVLLADGSLRPENSTPQTLRRLEAEIELPEAVHGIPGGLLKIEAELGDSERIDPLSLIRRPVSSQNEWEWKIDWRHEVAGTHWIWGVYLQEQGPAEQFWLTRIRRRDGRHSARAYVEWRPRDRWRGGVTFDWSRLQGHSEVIFADVRVPDSVAELSSEVGRDQSSRLSAWVEWEVRDQVKLTLSVNTGRESSTNISVHEAAGGLLYQDARDYDAVPAVSIGLRFNR